jgi:uncharacterized protein
MKYLLLIVVVAVVLWLLMRTRRTGGAGDAERPGRAKPPALEMIACAHCGMHLPRDEALVDAGSRRYCSEAHRVLGPH